MNQKVIEKLQKLIRHEESARAIGSINEATAFANQIQKLLTANQLSMSDIEIQEEVGTAEQVDREILDPRDVGQKFVRKMVRWQITLLRGIASANNCDTLISPGSNYQHVVGLSNDRQAAVTLYRYFLKLSQDLCEHYFAEYKKTPEYTEVARLAWTAGETAAHSRQWKDSWLRGFTRTVADRMYDAKREAVEAAEQVDSQSNAIVHMRNKDAMVRDFIKNGDFKSIRQSSTATNYDAYDSGRKTGASVALSGGALQR